MSKRYSSYILVSIVFLTCLVCYFFETFLSWDAAYQVYKVLQNDYFYTTPTREIAKLLQFPLVLALKVFPDLSVQGAVYFYGLSYSFIPLLCVLLNLYITRENENIFLISSGIILTSLIFYQYQFLYEAVIAFQLFWPLINLELKHGINKLEKFLMFAIWILLFISHPVASIIYGLQITTICYKSKFKLSPELFTRIGILSLLGLTRFGLIFLTKDPEKLNYLFDASFGLKNILVDRSTIFFIIFKILMIHSFYLYTKYKFKRSFFYIVLNIGVFYLWDSTSPDSIVHILPLRHFLFLYPTAYFVIYLLKYNELEKIKFESYPLVLSFVFFACLLSFSLKRDQMLKNIDYYLKTKNINCVEKSVLPIEFGVNQWAIPFDYLLFQKTYEPKKLLIVDSDCEELRPGKDLKLSRYHHFDQRNHRFKFNDFFSEN